MPQRLCEKAGYRSEAFQLRRSLNTTALFNCTSVLSWGTDALTGAIMEYSPNRYFVELIPRKGARTGHRAALQFVLLNAFSPVDCGCSRFENTSEIIGWRPPAAAFPATQFPPRLEQGL